MKGKTLNMHMLECFFSNKYEGMVKSNRESGYGRYDVVMEPKDIKDTAVIMEFKVFDAFDEESLEDTASNALKQIEEKNP